MKRLFYIVISLVVFSVKSQTTTVNSTIYAYQDAIVDNQNADTNYADVTYLAADVFDNGGSSAIKRGYFKFRDQDLPPSYATIVSATITLSGLDAPDTGHTTMGGTSSLLRLVTANWYDTSITWNNQPSNTSNYEVSLNDANNPDEDYIVDVKSQLEEIIGGSTNYYGFFLLLSDENAGPNPIRMRFASKDHTSQLEAYMTITYTIPKVIISLQQLTSKLFTGKNNSDGNIDIEVSGGLGSSYSYSWSPGSMSTQDISGLSEGTYTVLVTDSVGITATDSFTIKDDGNHNWVHVTNFNENKQLTSSTKHYYDNIGRNIQSQAYNIEDNTILAQQTIFDGHGRTAIQSLVAPIGNEMLFKSNFITNDSDQVYSYTDFDLSTTLNNPNEISQVNANSLGHFYSDSSIEDFQATSNFPYSRTTYTQDPYSRPTKSAISGDEYVMGQGKESKSVSLYSSGELSAVYGSDSSFKVMMDTVNPLYNKSIQVSGKIVAGKIIQMDRDGKTYVSYYSDGKLIAKCRGKNSSLTPSLAIQSQVTLFLGEGGVSSDIHIPASTDDSLYLPLPQHKATYESSWTDIRAEEITYAFYDILTNQSLTSGTDYSINATSRKVTFSGAYETGEKFIRIQASLDADLIQNVTDNNGSLPVYAQGDYYLDYYNWEINYYDLNGRPRKNVSRKGFDITTLGNFNMYSSFDFDPHGNMIASSLPDEGISNSLYNSDNLLRFSQNSIQQTTSSFSYFNYDEIGRIKQYGEYLRDAQDTLSFEFFDYYQREDTFQASINVNFILAHNDSLDLANSHSDHYISYYTLDSVDYIPANYSHYSDYTPFYLLGQVSKTWNENNSSWYAYDALGRVLFLVQKIEELEFDSVSSTLDDKIKSLDYHYLNNTSALVDTIWYQKNEMGEYLRTIVSFNKNLSPSGVTIGTNNNDRLAISKYSYDVKGRLVRKEIGDSLQGVDYVYTINDLLKSINHPSLNNNNDPGFDGLESGEHSAFGRDLFGFSLDYHKDDFKRAQSNIVSSSTSGNDGQYNGLIHASRWKIKGENKIYRGVDSDVQLYQNDSLQKEIMYRYSYDDDNQLGTATYGIFNSTSSSFASRDDYRLWGQTNGSTYEDISFDANGNIEELRRNAYTGTAGLSLDSLLLNYSSTNNKLTSILDGSVNSYNGDFATTGTDNYTYDVMGQLTSSQADNIDSIQYYFTGQVSKIYSSDSSLTEYEYNEKQQLLKKTFIDTLNSVNEATWYVYGLGGNLISVYEKSISGILIELEQQPLSGMDRIGSHFVDDEQVIYELSDHLGNVRVTFEEFDLLSLDPDLSSTTGWSAHFNSTVSSGGTPPNEYINVTDGTWNGDLYVAGAYYSFSTEIGRTYRVIYTIDPGDIDYEMRCNISSSVSTSVSIVQNYHTTTETDTLIFTATSTLSYLNGISKDQTSPTHYFRLSNISIRDIGDPVQIVEWSDYYPFGKVMPGRNSVASNSYAFGYQGQQSSHNGNLVAFQLRLYNPSIGRFLSVDPYHQFHSSYLGMANNPVSFIDPTGGLTFTEGECKCKSNSPYPEGYENGAYDAIIHSCDGTGGSGSGSTGTYEDINGPFDRIPPSPPWQAPYPGIPPPPQGNGGSPNAQAYYNYLYNRANSGGGSGNNGGGVSSRFWTNLARLFPNNPINGTGGGRGGSGGGGSGGHGNGGGNGGGSGNGPGSGGESYWARTNRIWAENITKMREKKEAIYRYNAKMNRYINDRKADLNGKMEAILNAPAERGDNSVKTVSKVSSIVSLSGSFVFGLTRELGGFAQGADAAFNQYIKAFDRVTKFNAATQLTIVTGLVLTGTVSPTEAIPLYGEVGYTSLFGFPGFVGWQIGKFGAGRYGIINGSYWKKNNKKCQLCDHIKNENWYK